VIVSSFSWNVSGYLVVAACAACAPGTPAPMVVDAPAIEATPQDTSAVELPAPDEPVPATFAVTFGSEELVPLSRMRMVVGPGSDARGVELEGEGATLTGVAERAGDEDHWLVGLSGMTGDACIVVRMSMHRQGDGLRGWATIDADGWASSVSVVADRIDVEESAADTAS
jgi:hypothetical protein